MEQVAEWHYSEAHIEDCQRLGMACTECRRRKLRCDGQQPQCENCESSGLVCQVSVRHARGPKRGHMAALRKKVAELESRLASQQQIDNDVTISPIMDFTSEQSISDWNDVNVMPLQSGNNASVMDFTSEQSISEWNDFNVITSQSGNNTSVTEEEATFSSLVSSTDVPPITATATSTTPPLAPSPLTNLSITTSPPTADTSIATSPRTAVTSLSNTPPQLHELTGFIPAELDQLYFERIHPAIPLLHQRSYLAWSRQEVKKNSRTCLQYAMWTLAALLSAQFQYLQESLYQRSTQMLNTICSSSGSQDPLDKEQAQAWLLISIYELMRSFHRQAWMSAGRAFRLVQLLRLHELDTPAQATTPEEDFTDKEERRRVFWVAYFLDHLFSISNNWPTTLNEHVICTRLLASENDFQNERPVLGSFLSEAITERQPRYPSPFNEAIIFATLCGRRLLYCQQFHIRAAYGDIHPHWMHSNLMLDSILKQRLEILSECYPSHQEANGPMLHFVNIMAQSSIIYSFTSMDMLLRGDEGKPQLAEYQLRAIAAADQIIKLAQTLTESFVFKIHPLSSIPLMLCAEFLFKNKSAGEVFTSLIERLSKVFKQIRDIDDPKQSYIDVMKRWPCSAKGGGKKQQQTDDNPIT